jgi:septal ring factor EnvC (AmiA/AmiB activator)
MENEVEHGEQRRSEQLNKLLELENDKRLFGQTKAALERDLKERERKIDAFDEKYKKLDDENTKQLDMIREANAKIRNIDKGRHSANN